MEVSNLLRLIQVYRSRFHHPGLIFWIRKGNVLTEANGLFPGNLAAVLQPAIGLKAARIHAFPQVREPAAVKKEAVVPAAGRVSDLNGCAVLDESRGHDRTPRPVEVGFRAQVAALSTSAGRNIPFVSICIELFGQRADCEAAITMLREI